MEATRGGWTIPQGANWRLSRAVHCQHLYLCAGRFRPGENLKKNCWIQEIVQFDALYFFSFKSWGTHQNTISHPCPGEQRKRDASNEMRVGLTKKRSAS
ncbi:hypothetical protein WAE31_04805 (plasmid) [Xanthomonas axonopodis pv. vasculorum]